MKLRVDTVTRPETLAAGVRRSEELHGLMWSDAMDATESRPALTNALVL